MFNLKQLNLKSFVFQNSLYVIKVVLGSSSLLLVLKPILMMQLVYSDWYYCPKPSVLSSYNSYTVPAVAACTPPPRDRPIYTDM